MRERYIHDYCRTGRLSTIAATADLRWMRLADATCLFGSRISILSRH